MHQNENRVRKNRINASCKWACILLEKENEPKTMHHKPKLAFSGSEKYDGKS